MSLPVAIFCLTVINNGCVFEWLTRLNFPVEQEKEFVWLYPIREASRRTVSKTFQTAVSIVILRGKNKRVKVNKRVKSKPYGDASNCQLQVKQ